MAMGCRRSSLPVRAPSLHGAQQLKLASKQNQAHIELLPRAWFKGPFYVASQGIVFFSKRLSDRPGMR